MDFLKCSSVFAYERPFLLGSGWDSSHCCESQPHSPATSRKRGLISGKQAIRWTLKNRKLKNNHSSWELELKFRNNCPPLFFFISQWLSLISMFLCLLTLNLPGLYIRTSQRQDSSLIQLFSGTLIWVRCLSLIWSVPCLSKEPQPSTIYMLTLLWAEQGKQKRELGRACKITYG